jgi:hypothetical protein
MQGRLPWFTLDARKSIEELQIEIKAISETCLEESKSKDITRLW